MGPIPIINFMGLIFLILFSSLSISNAIVLDTDGDPLLNGGKYYIRPVSTTLNGGLTISSGCPYYITQNKAQTSPGTPVTISSPAKIGYILTGLRISFTFDENIVDTCMKPFKWQVITDEKTSKSYVRTGGSGWSTDFSIFEDPFKAGSYRIKYYVNDNVEVDLGFIEKDGLLGINDGNPVSVVFMKTGFDVLDMKV